MALARSTPAVLALSLMSPWLVNAQFSISSDSDIKESAATIAWDLLQYYSGNESGQVPGILPGPPPAGDYYWWEGGAMWGTLIDYWYLTGDDTYNDIVSQALLFQTGPDDDYMPDNYTISMGNDDQGFWGMTALVAAENKFPDPPKDQPQWLALGQGVWNDQASPDRYDGTCNGGLRWQVPPTNAGYNYKASIANGCFFNMGARLARYTNNDTYAKRAEEVFDWMLGVGFIDNDSYAVYDGASVESNCTDTNKEQFSYNNAVLVLGAAHMYNYTGEAKWKDRLDKLVDYGLGFFFENGVVVEKHCEDSVSCTTDMLSYKGYVHRWYATTTKVAPHTADKILPALKTSAEAAASVCTGGDLGRQCGFAWASGQFDNLVGAGQQMDALAAISSLLIDSTSGPVTNKTGGTSKGDVNAGGTSGTDGHAELSTITTADKAGAGIVTAIMLCGAGGILAFMNMGKGP